MTKNILATIGEYTNSEIAAHYALAFTKATQGKLFLVHVDEGEASNESLRLAQEALERLFLEAKKEGIEVESVVASGPLIGKLASLVEENKIDIVFTATRSDSLRRHPFFKTTAKVLMDTLTCDVAVVRVTSMGGVHPKHILVLLRQSLGDIKARAFFVTRLAEQFQSHVALFCLNGAGKLKEQCEEFRNYLKSYNIRQDRRRGKGAPSRAVRHEAIHSRSDLIVIELGKRTLLHALWGGHPLEELLRDPPCNLIIFKKGKS